MYKKWLAACLDLLFPEVRHCPFCWRAINGAGTDGLCYECSRKILKLSRSLPFCPRCGRFTAAAICPNCCDWSDELSGVISVVPYDGIFKEKIFDLKFNNKTELALPLGFLMAAKAKDRLIKGRKTIGMPIPLHPLRAEERGYNQSALLARIIMRELNLPYTEDVLIRQRYEKSQISLGRTERRINLRDSFIVQAAGKIRQKTVILVDDVLTTGATMAEAAKVLAAAGAEDVIGLTWGAGIDKNLLNLGLEINFSD